MQPLLIELFIRQAKQKCKPELVNCLSSSADPKKREAIQHLSRLSDQELLDIIDVVIKWLWIRFQEHDSKTYKEILEFTEALIYRLESLEYQLREEQAQLLIPMLCDKLATASPYFKPIFRALLLKIKVIYDPDRYMDSLLVIIPQRNSKIQLECLDLLTKLIQYYEADYLNSGHAARLIQLLKSDDHKVKLTATGVLALVYTYLKDEIWELLGTIDDEVRTILQQRFRLGSMGKPAHSPKSLSLSVADPPITNIVLQDDDFLNLIGRDGHSTEVYQMSIENTLPVRIAKRSKHNSDVLRTASTFKADETNLVSPREGSEPEEIEQDSELVKMIKCLYEGGIADTLEALIEINSMLISDKLEELLDQANHLVESLVLLLQNTLARNLVEIPVKFSKFMINVIYAVCSNKSLIRALSGSSLQNLLNQLISSIIIESLETIGNSGEGAQIQHSINNCILMLIETADVTNVFRSLINLLSPIEPSHKYLTLVIRCILKLLKVLNLLLDRLKIDDLLLCIHEHMILQTKLKSSISSDLGMNTVQTVLSELVKLIGSDVFKYYEKVRNHSHPDLYIEKWIQVILDHEPEAKLKDIYTMIMSEQFYNKGIEMLYLFVEINPGADLSSFVVKFDSFTYSKIIEDMKKLKERNEQNDLSKKISNLKMKCVRKSQTSSNSAKYVELRAKVTGLLSKKHGKMLSEEGEGEGKDK